MIFPPEPTALTEIDRSGICVMAKTTDSPDVGTPFVGMPYWYLSSLNPWNARGWERFERSAVVLRRTAACYDRHEILTQNGQLVIHQGVSSIRRHGGYRRTCYPVHRGTGELRTVLGLELAPLMLRLGESFLGCAVDATGICWWWPWKLADLTGVSPLQALGERAPLRLKEHHILPAPTVSAPHVDCRVTIGTYPATCHSVPQAGGRFHLYFLEHRATRRRQRPTVVPLWRAG